MKYDGLKKKMVNYKASGADRIPVELFKALKDGTLSKFSIQ